VFHQGEEGFLQRAAGYSLTGSTVEHCLFLLWGTGRNGKSTFLEVLGHIIGTYGQSASMSTFLEQKYDGIPNDLAALAGSRFVTAVETQDSRRLDEAKVKQITGGDTVTARFLLRTVIGAHGATKTVRS
jgi:putative DNA primase/helicase